LKKLFKKKPSLLFTILVLLMACLIFLIEITKGIKLFYLELVRELLIVSAVYIILSILAPNLYPRRIDPETVFIGGATKPPYFNPNEVYLPVFTFKKPKKRSKA
jgi:hypothetical protein